MLNLPFESKAGSLEYLEWTVAYGCAFCSREWGPWIPCTVSPLLLLCCCNLARFALLRAIGAGLVLLFVFGDIGNACGMH